ncbi:MAG TPA: type II secretion system F family protein [Bryobacteraceae bacterium]|nr:type II secretion system F family protein [Bryobacteraceae bacterium]
MSDIWIGIAFFAFVLVSVTVAGYLFFLKPRETGRMDAAASGVLTPSANESPGTALLDFFHSIGTNFPGSRKEENPYRRHLVTAGYRLPSALPVFYGIKCASSLLGAALAGTLSVIAGSAEMPLIAMACGMGFGFLLPDRILKWRAKERGLRLRTALPAALDLMVMGIEAGQSLDYTVADASRGLRITHPDLSTEFGQLYLELRAGTSRAEAFRNLAERNREPELRKLVSLLIDSDRFGAPLGPTLRTHTKYLRTRFRQQAQETARKVGVKLIFPIFFLIFPSVLLVTLGPACLMMYQQLKAMMV